MGNDGVKSKRKFFKFNEDDILENKDLPLIAVVGDLEDDELGTLDLEHIDTKMDFNGSH